MADIQVMSFNAGELSELLDGRSDLEKYYSGCRLSENMIPLPYGPSERRPGTYFVAECKNNDKKAKLVSFQYSTEQAYMLEYGDEYIRFYMDRGEIQAGVGTEDLSALDNIIAHWLLNDNAANAAVLDDDGNTHDATASVNTELIHEEGQVGTGCFNLDSIYAVSVTDDADFTFVEGVDGTFSIAGWIYVTNVATDQIILSKWDETLGSQGREWKLLLDSSQKLKLCIADESLLLDTDLIAHWKLNDSATDAVVADALGNYDGALTDGDSNYTSDHSVAGKVGNAFDFDGTDDKVKIDDAAAFSFGDAADDSPFSISAWINMDDATFFIILNKDDAVGTSEWRFDTDGSDKLRIMLFDDDNNNYIARLYNTALTAQQGSWLHVVATYDATEAATGLSLYINGNPVDDITDNAGSYTAMHSDNSDVYIGYNFRSELYSNGKIDNVMLFNKELSQAEVTVLYKAGNGIEELNTVYPYAVSDDALGVGWHFVVSTYDGVGGATAADGIILYVDGAAVGVTATELTTYSKMEDTDALPRIGAQESTAGVIEKIFANKIDNIALFSDVLSAEEVASLYSTSAYEISSSYLEADLFGLQRAQSADVLYNVHSDYPQSKLIRYAHNVWELEDIVFDWPPFLSENDGDTTITPSGTTGSITLTATSSIFTSDHVGSYWLIKHPRTADEATAPNKVGSAEADGFFNAAGEVTGSLKDVKGTWYFQTAGTWTGEIVVERSYDEGTTWHSFPSHTSEGDQNFNISGNEEDGNAWYRARAVDPPGTLAWANEVIPTLSVGRYYHYGIVEITGFTSAISVTATVVRTVGATTATKLWSEGAWSDERGYPVTTTFFEGRQFYAGTSYRPLDIWGSSIPNYENMELGTLDTDSVKFVVDSGMQNMIRWLVGQEVLLIGTSGGEWRLGSIDPADAITPTNPMRPRIQTTYGSKEIQALLLANAVLFVDAQGRRVRGAQYIFEKGEAGGYDAPDYTMLSEHITKSGIIDMAYQQNPYPILWCVRDDGVLIGMVFEPGQKVWGWFRCVIDGDVESVAVIKGVDEDEIWIIVKREIGGVDKRYIEYFKPRDWGDDQADCFFVDSGLSFDGGDAVTIASITGADPGVVTVTAWPVDGNGDNIADGDQVRIMDVVGMVDVNNKVFTVSSADTTAKTFELKDKLDTTNWDTSGYDAYVSGGTVQKVDNVFGGLSHLEGKTVSVLGDGSVHADVVVSSAIVTLTDYFNKCHIGLPYISKLMPMKLAVPGANIRGKIKRIHQIIFSFYKTLGAKFGTTSGEDTIPFRRTTDAMGSPPPIFTGEKEKTFRGGYELNGDIYVEQAQPLPLCVRSITAKLQIHGD